MLPGHTEGIATMAARMLSFTRTLSEDNLHSAMFDVANIFCDALAMDAGRDVETLDDADVIAAMRQPVTMASAFSDLCDRLGIAPPPAVRRALDW